MLWTKDAFSEVRLGFVDLRRLSVAPFGSIPDFSRDAAPSGDEFGTEEDPLGWDAAGWENVG